MFSLEFSVGIPLSQTYSSSVNVGGLLPIGPVVMHQGDTGMVIPDNPPITAERMDKPPALKNLKLTFSTRSFESLTYLDIPTFLSAVSYTHLTLPTIPAV